MKGSIVKLLGVIAFLAVYAYNPAAHASASEAKQFIEKLSKNALDNITSNASNSQKESKLTELFIASVDTKWMARFAMGKYWRDAAEAQRSKYTEIYTKYLLKGYIPKFKEYNNQQIKINKSYSDSEGTYIVETKIISSDGAAINVDYKVRQESGKYMIFDVIAEGVSLITTQRSDFASVLARDGVDGLISKLGSR